MCGKLDTANRIEQCVRIMSVYMEFQEIGLKSFWRLITITCYVDNVVIVVISRVKHKASSRKIMLI